MSVATDNVIATIASILDFPQPEPVATTDNATQSKEPLAVPDKPVVIAPIVTAPIIAAPIEAEGYSKAGPGPITALRFKWTVRRGDDGFYVDETIGTNLSPVSNGPLEAEAAIKFVDARADSANAHFEALKSEMTGRGPPAPILAWSAGEK